MDWWIFTTAIWGSTKETRFGRGLRGVAMRCYVLFVAFMLMFYSQRAGLFQFSKSHLQELLKHVSVWEDLEWLGEKEIWFFMASAVGFVAWSPALRCIWWIFLKVQISSD